MNIDKNKLKTLEENVPTFFSFSERVLEFPCLQIGRFQSVMFMTFKLNGDQICHWLLGKTNDHHAVYFNFQHFHSA